MTLVEACAAAGVAAAIFAEARLRVHRRRDDRQRQADRSLAAGDIEALHETLDRLQTVQAAHEERLRRVEPGDGPDDGAGRTIRGP